MITTSMAHSISQTLWVTDHPSLIPRWHNLLSMLFALTCSNVLLHNMLGTAVEIDTGLAPDQIVTTIPQNPKSIKQPVIDSLWNRTHHLDPHLSHHISMWTIMTMP